MERYLSNEKVPFLLLVYVQILLLPGISGTWTPASHA